jgi:hypothetical protein
MDFALFTLQIVCWIPRVLHQLDLMADNICTDQLEMESCPMPTLRRNLPDIVNMRFHKVHLDEGWTKSGTEVKVGADGSRKKVDTWILRELTDCVVEAREFMRDLSASLTGRQAMVAPLVVELAEACDFANLLNLLCGTRRQHSDDARLTLGEAELANCGMSAWRKQYANVRQLPHLTEFLHPDEDVRSLDDFKSGLRWLVWSPHSDATRLRASIFVTEDGVLPSVPPISMARVELEDGDADNLLDRFIFQFEGLESVTAYLDEAALIKAIYTDKSLYSRIGKPACIMLDVSLSRGGPEAVVESMYSVMKAQTSDGGQSNRTMVLRTKVDWMLPLPIACPNTVAEIAREYQKTHKAPVLKMTDTRTRHWASQTVLKRLEKTAKPLFDCHS